MAKDWINTYTGRAFKPLTPSAKDIDIEDIAHALSHICRYTGHTKKHYSVAEHCVYVSRLLPKELKLAGLLHDASEAYMNDIARPVKYQAAMNGYRKAEAKLSSLIDKHFGICLSKSEASRIHEIDGEMIHIEAPQLFDKLNKAWPLRKSKFKVKIGMWTPAKAKREFVKRFKELTK